MYKNIFRIFQQPIGSSFECNWRNRIIILKLIRNNVVTPYWLIISWIIKWRMISYSTCTSVNTSILILCSSIPNTIRTDCKIFACNFKLHLIFLYCQFVFTTFLIWVKIFSPVFTLIIVNIKISRLWSESQFLLFVILWRENIFRWK